MAKSDYGPGRRRRGQALAVLDWAAGVLIGGVLVAIGLGVLELLGFDAAARGRVSVTLMLVMWPIGAALGVWLANGPPLSGRGLGLALGLASASTMVVGAPLWLEVESVGVRWAAVVALMLIVPIGARVGVKRAAS